MFACCATWTCAGFLHLLLLLACVAACVYLGAGRLGLFVIVWWRLFILLIAIYSFVCLLLFVFALLFIVWFVGWFTVVWFILVVLDCWFG